MACGLTAGRRGAQKPGISKYPQLRWVRSDGWIFRAVIRQSRRLRICGGSEVVTRFFQASSQSSHTQQQCTVIQRITVSNISVTALPQVIYLHPHAHLSEKRPWIVACRFQPAGAWERLLQAPARRGAATVWILGTGFLHQRLSGRFAGLNERYAQSRVAFPGSRRGSNP